MLLTLSVMQLVVNDQLPTTSDATPILGNSYRAMLRRARWCHSISSVRLSVCLCV